jgi:hypothetical protein
MWVFVSYVFGETTLVRHFTPEYQVAFVPLQAILYRHNVSELQLRLSSETHVGLCGMCRQFVYNSLVSHLMKVTFRGSQVFCCPDIEGRTDRFAD